MFTISIIVIAITAIVTAVYAAIGLGYVAAHWGSLSKIKNESDKAILIGIAITSWPFMAAFDILHSKK